MYTKAKQMRNPWLTIKQLDRQLNEWQAVSKRYGRPTAGWVKTLREALNMSAEQLAQRLGLSRSRVVQLENAEIHDAITLRTLRETADALECELVYAIVPKADSTLAQIIERRAEQLANERVARVAHTMALEKQALDADILKDQKWNLAKNLAENLNKKFWASDKKNKSRKSVFTDLIKSLKKGK